MPPLGVLGDSRTLKGGLSPHIGEEDAEGPFSLPAGEVDLIARRGEVSQLAQLLGQRSHYSGVLLAGAAGVGKTRVSTEVLRELGPDIEVVTVTATWPNRPTPAGGDRPGTAEDRATARGVPPLEIKQVIESVRNRQRGTLLFVDDAHLLEPAAAALILEAAQRRTVRMLLTLNTDEPAPMAITMLWKDDHLHRADLRPLDITATRRLVAAWSGRRLAHKTAASLARLAQGNPQLARELIRAATEHGLFEPSPAGWTMSGPLPLSAPLCELTTRKIGRLSLGAREVLERIVVAEPVSLPRLEQVARQELLLELEEDGFIRVLAAPSADPQAPLLVEVSHPLISYTISHTMPVLRRRAHLEGWLAVYPELALCDGQDAATVAGWMLDTGTPISTSELLRATQCAEDVQDLDAASRLSAAAWSQSPSAGSATAHARSLIAQGDFTGATRVLDAASSSFPSTWELSAVRARGYLLQGRFREAESTIAGLPEPQRRLFMGMAAYFQGAIDTALDLCKPLATEHVEAALFYMASLLHAGRPQDAIRVYEQLPASPQERPFHRDSFEQIYAVALSDIGQLREATRRLAHAYRGAVSDGRVRFDAQRGLALGAVLLERGRPSEALTLLTFHPSYQVGWPLWHSRARTLRSLAALTLGRTNEVDVPEETPSHFLIFQQVSQAWMCALSGNRESAAEILLRAADTAAKQGAYAHIAIAAHEMARIGVAPVSRPYWRTPLQGEYLNARLDYARGLTTEDIPTVRQAAEVFADCGAELYASEAYAELSRLLRRTAQGRAATAASRRAKELAERCEGATTPALWLLSSNEPLTSREQELVTLVAQGRSDKEIAQQLTLSVRTVSNHLYRVYRKLGVNNRRALQQQAGLSSRTTSLSGP
ncbi:LuxR C-terminal-related transcriptional regulator [Streptomyces sp. NPDC056480]|uniref:LuxR C-terminal-related transcriptional regulator n=1 Tax=Streptomyces sp. NPDC056480 TaxID=3345833 RepID=UPI00368584AD